MSSPAPLPPLDTEGGSPAAPHPAALVSVVIPSFNARPWIGDAIDSVLAQTYTPIETIVVDDGSTDGTGDMLRARYGTFIEYVFQTNQGLSRARNVGIRRARGGFVQLLDADDRLHADKIRLQVEMFAEHPECAAVYSDFEEFTDADPGTMRPSPAEFKRKSRTMDVLAGLLTGNFLMCADPLVRRAALIDAGMFDESLLSCEDYDLWIKIAARGGRFMFIDRVLAYYRHRPGSMSTARVRQLSSTIEVHRRVRHLDRRLTREEVRLVRRHASRLQEELAVALRQERREGEAVRHVLSAIGRAPGEVGRILVDTYLRKPRQMRNILFTHTGGGLGDLLLSTPIVEALKRQFPDSEITCWVNPAHAPVLVGNPSVDRIWTADPLSRWRTLREQLRDAHYDLAVLPWTNTRQAWLLALAGIPRRVGPSSRLQYGFLFTDRVRDVASHGDTTTHFVDAQLGFARVLGCDTSGLVPGITLSPSERADAAAVLEGEGVGSDEPFCVLHVGRGMDLRNRPWPTERFSAIGRQLHEELGYRVVLTGTTGERDVVNGVAIAIGAAAVNLAGRTNLRQACAVIARTRLCVSLDTGPMHLAAALGVPVVGLFPMACYPPGRWHPYGVPYRVVRTAEWQCPRHCVKETCPDFQCHDEIDVTAVVRAAHELLAGQAARA